MPPRCATHYDRAFGRMSEQNCRDAEMGTEFCGMRTRGLLERPTCQVHLSSEALDWTSISVSYQTEAPFNAVAKASPHHLLVFHLTGPARLRSRSGPRQLERVVPAGGIGFLPAFNDVEIDLRDTIRTLHIALPNRVLEELEPLSTHGSLTSTMLEPLCGERDDLLMQLGIEVWHAAQCRDSRSSLYADELARSIAARLIWLNRSRFSANRTEPRGELSRKKMSQIEEFISSHLSEDIKLEDMAQIVGLSSSHFTRQFTKLNGISPYKYVLKCRIENAKQRLRFSRENLVDIALDCGFANQEHFTHVFTRLAGTTPTRFRRSYSSEVLAVA